MDKEARKLRNEDLQQVVGGTLPHWVIQVAKVAGDSVIGAYTQGGANAVLALVEQRYGANSRLAVFVRNAIS